MTCCLRLHSLKQAERGSADTAAVPAADGAAGQGPHSAGTSQGCCLRPQNHHPAQLQSCRPLRTSPGETFLPQGLDDDAGDVHGHDAEGEVLQENEHYCSLAGKSLLSCGIQRGPDNTFGPPMPHPCGPKLMGWWLQATDPCRRIIILRIQA